MNARRILAQTDHCTLLLIALTTEEVEAIRETLQDVDVADNGAYDDRAKALFAIADRIERQISGPNVEPG